MIVKLEDHRKVTLQEAQRFYKTHYTEATDIAKIKLKCWMYYCEGNNEANRESLNYYDYNHRQREIDYLSHIKSYLIDLSDIGSKEEAIKIVRSYYQDKE